MFARRYRGRNHRYGRNSFRMASILAFVHAEVSSTALSMNKTQFFPILAARHIEQRSVVFFFVFDNVAAEVQDRQREQAFVD